MKIDKIGIEFEVVGENYSNYSYKKRKYRKRFTKIRNSDILTHLCPEYYHDQSEWKFFPMEATSTNIDKVRQFILSTLNKDNITIYAPGPNYVGTHIHLFLSNNGQKLIDIPSSGNKIKLAIFDYIYNEIYEFFIAHKDILTNNLKYEVNRVIRNHNILRYFDINHLDNGLRNNLYTILGCEYMLYNDEDEIVKHQPILWSNSNWNGKPFSLELRIIPNLFFIYNSGEKLVNIINNIEFILNNYNKYSSDYYKDNIINTHKKLCLLFKKIN